MNIMANKDDLIEKLNTKKENYVDQKLLEVVTKNIGVAISIGIGKFIPKAVEYISSYTTPYLPQININFSKIGSAGFAVGSASSGLAGFYEISQDHYEEAKPLLINSALMGAISLGCLYSGSISSTLSSSTVVNNITSSAVIDNITSGAGLIIKNLPTIGFGVASLKFGAETMYEIYNNNYNEIYDPLLKSAFFAGVSFSSLYYPMASMIGYNIATDLYSIWQNVNKYGQLINQINLTGEDSFMIEY